MNILSLFTGAGGLDLGFKRAGFKVVWANEYDRTIWKTFRRNFPDTPLDTRSIQDIPSNEIPSDVVGVIGGPPCQSWSEAGALRGIEDERGKLFYEYVRVIKDKRPLFFLAENVSGILSKRHENAFKNILKRFEGLGYIVSYSLLNAHDYGVPQDRRRVIIVGYREDMKRSFVLSKPCIRKTYLVDAIADLKDAMPVRGGGEGSDPAVPNHEYMTGGFSSMYMSRNRVRSWNEPSFTIQAGGRHAPIHPQAPKMVRINSDSFMFVRGKGDLYRRLSVRECARVQTFPDDFVFEYNSVANGYKMVGNAVPVKLAEILGKMVCADVLPTITKGTRYLRRGKIGETYLMGVAQ
ncbi:MAG: DNA cytosine methyltransferase [Candidatus Kaiserbacteria bacterium]|nr:DNA cytosine methyltransferase [Candidatus Kaiserbacteria bacterium]